MRYEDYDEDILTEKHEDEDDYGYSPWDDWDEADVSIGDFI